MWKDSMHDWLNVDMSKNNDIVGPKCTLSNDDFVVRCEVGRRCPSDLPERLSNLAVDGFGEG